MRSKLAMLGVVWLAVGCGDGGIPLVPVHGTVTLAGKPLAGKTVKFVPEAGTPGQGGGGNTDKDGKYTALAVRPGATRDKPGLPAGSYRVVVTEPMFPIDLPVQSANDTEPAPAIGLPPATKKPTIPAIYGNPETTPLRVEVSREKGEINLQLK